MNKLLYRTTGRYYLGESAQQAQYVFQFRDDAPSDLQKSFLIDLAKDEEFSGSALEVAQSIQEIIDSYWINSDQPKIKAVVEYLEKWDERDRHDSLLKEREVITKRLAEIESELSQYENEESA